MVHRSLCRVLFATLLVTACGSDSDSSDDGDAVDRDAAGGDISPIDGGGDAGGTSDTAGSDASPDAVPDTGDDAGTDTGTDTEADAGTDTEADAGSDVGEDIGDDVGADTSDDVGADAGADTGTDTTVDWCRLHFPASIETGLGSTVTFYARVFEEGLTDRTTGTDVDDSLLAEVGWGADGSTPNDAWTWRSADGNVGWVDTQEPGNDEYIGEWVTSEAGTFDVAFRFSLDDGATWQLCDLAAGVGADGAENGYQPDNAANLVVVDVCADACDETPASECVDETTVRTFSGPGDCIPDGLSPRCEFPSTETACDDGQICRLGACVVDTPVVDWCRLQFPLSLRGLEGDETDAFVRLFEPGVTDLSTDNDDPESLLVVELGYGPDGAAVDGESWSWTAATPNPGYVAVDEPDNDEHFATLVYPAAGEWDYAFRASLDGTTWTYCDGPGGPGADGAENGYQADNAGQLTVDETPDSCEPNPCTTPPPSVCVDETRVEVYEATGVCDNEGETIECAYAASEIPCDAGDVCRDGACVPDSFEVSWCRLQFPLDAVLLEEETTTFYGRVYIEGLTDRSTAVDTDPAVLAQFGYGSLSDAPDTGAWTWFDATPNVAWDGAAVSETDNDEYEATIGYDDVDTLLSATAFRFSGDGGESWLYCDADAGPGSDGAEDGFQLDNSGLLTRGEISCDPNPCVGEISRFCDGSLVTEVDSVGTCVEDPTGVTCDYPTTTIEDCADGGGTCVDGACEFPSDDACEDPYACALPPAPFCDGSVATRVESIGACTDVDGAADCAFTEVTEDCTDGGGSCVDGACLTVAAVEPTFCRLQFPLSSVINTGDSVDYFVRFYAAGLTDITSATDLYPAVRVQVGVGIGRDPSEGPLAWRWVDATANEGYDGTTFGEPNNDEYQATVPFDEAGVFRTAARVSGNAGATWIYCDGQDAGSSNGISVDDLGVVTVTDL